MEEHGGNIWSRLEVEHLEGKKAKLITNDGRKKLLDFSANINPLGLPQRVTRTIQENIPYLVHYPDPEALYLRQQIGEYIGLAPDEILPGNGTTQLIYLIYKVLNPKLVIIPVPSFSEYEKAVSHSRPPRRFFYRLRDEEGFRLNLNRLLRDIDRLIGFDGRRPVPQNISATNIVILGNPNNPTGTFLSIDETTRLVKELDKRRVWLVVDEAFIDFVPDVQSSSLVSRVNRYRNLIVLRTFTKFFAMPGLRLGYAAAHKSVILKLKSQLEPWSVNHLAQAAAAVILKDKEYIRHSREYVFKEKKYLFSQLNKISFLEPYPSSANFILCRLKPNSSVQDSYHLCRSLEQKGIMVRNCANFRNLGRFYIRVAVRTRAENRQLIQGLRGQI